MLLLCKAVQDLDKELQATTNTQIQNWRRDRKPKEERFFKDFIFEIAGENLKIHQQNVETMESVGRTVWDAGIVLAKYLEHLPREKVKGKRILELGSGTGVAGFSAALMGAHVTLTDNDSLELLDRTLKDNGLHANAQIRRLDWGKSLSEYDWLEFPYNMILCSDLIYYPHLVEPLVTTLNDLCKPETTIVFSTETHVAHTTNVFLSLIEQTFTVEKIPQDDMDPIYRADDISIFYLRKKI